MTDSMQQQMMDNRDRQQANNVLALFDQILIRIRVLSAKIDLLLTQGNTIMADLTQLTSQVQQNTTVEGSAVALINGLAAQITAAGTDPTALAALVTQLQTSSDQLAAAVTANTPATGGGSGGGTPPPPTPAGATRVS